MGVELGSENLRKRGEKSHTCIFSPFPCHNPCKKIFHLFLFFITTTFFLHFFIFKKLKIEPEFFIFS